MINIGKAIYNILTGTTLIYSVVNNRIFPIVANENTVMPFIVYERSSTAEHTRDNNTVYNSSLDIVIFSSDYKQGVDIGELIINQLNHLRIEINNINIIDSRIINIEEGFDSLKYMQRLTFNIKSY